MEFKIKAVARLLIRSQYKAINESTTVSWLVMLVIFFHFPGKGKKKEAIPLFSAGSVCVDISGHMWHESVIAPDWGYE